MPSEGPKLSIKLSGAHTWVLWLMSLRSVATPLGVWKYIDPDSEPPAMPTHEDPYEFVKNKVIQRRGENGPAVTEKDVMAAVPLYMPLYTVQVKRITDEQFALNALVSTINAYIDQKYTCFLEGNETIREMVLSLKKNVAPTPEMIRINLRKQYRELIESPSTRWNLESFIVTWRQTLILIQYYKIPLDEDLLPDDFVQSTIRMYAGWEAIGKQMLYESESKGAKVSIYELIQSFQRHARSPQDTPSYSSRSYNSVRPAGFEATLNGRPPPSESDETSTNASESSTNTLYSKPTCVCGLQHRYENCWVLNPEQQPPGWILDPERQRKCDNPPAHRIPGLENWRKRKEAKEKATTDEQEKVDANFAAAGHMSFFADLDGLDGLIEVSRVT